MHLNEGARAVGFALHQSYTASTVVLKLEGTQVLRKLYDAIFINIYSPSGIRLFYKWFSPVSVIKFLI